MNDLKKVYRDAPRATSPAGLDQRVLRAAESRNPAGVSEKKPEKVHSGWRIAAFSVSTVCAFGIGLGVLLQTGAFDQGTSDLAVTDSATEAARLRVSENPAVAESAVPQTSPSPRQVLRRNNEIVDEELAANEESTTSIAAKDITVASGADLIVNPDSASGSSSTLNPEPMLTETIVPDSDADGGVAATEFSLQADTRAVTQADTQTDTQTDAQIRAEVMAAPPMLQESGNASAVASLAQQKSQPATSIESTVSGNNSAVRSFKEPGNKRATRARSQQWLLKQNRNEYTLQLAVGEDKVSLFLIADNLSVSTDQLKVSSGSWMLLHGRFQDRAAADSALLEVIESLAELPRVKALLEPKVVSFGEIRQRLR